LNKKKIYYAEAEKLYVVEQMTIEEIASRFNLAVRTIKYWKQGQGWDVKRSAYLESQQSSHKDGYMYARRLLRAIKEDQQEGRKVSAGRLRALAKITRTFLEMKKDDDKGDMLRKFFAPREKKTTLTPEEIEKIRREFLGME
jgi:transposase